MFVNICTQLPLTGTLWRHIGANHDKIQQKSTFNGDCAVDLNVEINRFFLVVFFTISRKLSSIL